eukprot:m.37173 g.37173  ORF g.37173 m.37173 type:complete len:211 (+) comp32338_c0_seq2:2804-3436(+)
MMAQLETTTPFGMDALLRYNPCHHRPAVPSPFTRSPQQHWFVWPPPGFPPPSSSAPTTKRRSHMICDILSDVSSSSSLSLSSHGSHVAVTSRQTPIDDSSSSRPYSCLAGQPPASILIKPTPINPHHFSPVGLLPTTAAATTPPGYAFTPRPSPPYNYNIFMPPWLRTDDGVHDKGERELLFGLRREDATFVSEVDLLNLLPCKCRYSSG